MNINAAIIDQQLSGIDKMVKTEILEQLNKRNLTQHQEHCLFFTFLCTKLILGLSDEDAIECLVDGGNDFGVDSIHIGEESDGEIIITMIQSKYAKNLKGDKNFPQSGIEKLVKAVTYLYNPRSELGSINLRLKSKVESIRSYISDGVIPKIRVIACNNGLSWNKVAQKDIDLFGNSNQVSWEHANHDKLVNIQQKAKPINETLHLKGKAIIEDMHFSRVCIGRISVKEIAGLMDKYSDRLLEKNIRRYLGLNGNRVNQDIYDTLQSNPENFYFFNNGLTLVCSDFSYNALQDSDYQINLKDLQIVNGGQTSKTLYEALKKMDNVSDDAYVLVRIYKLENNELALKITHATNSQNPVDLRDLRANDAKQIQLENSISQLGYTYRRKRSDTATKSSDITSGVVAEAVLSVICKLPHQAKFLIREHFGKLYEKIFTETLDGSQAVLSVLIYRIAENRRKKPMDSDPVFVRYASCFIAMQISKKLLLAYNLNTFSDVNYRNFSELKALLDKNSENYLNDAIYDIKKSIEKLYGKTDEQISLQQLSATFRRGDLINYLD